MISAQNQFQMIDFYTNRIGITGSIGSGKSTVCHVFESLGIPIFNADKEAKKLYFDNDVLNQVVKIVGSKAKTKNGLPDFAYIASVFFRDDDIYSNLSALLNPLIVNQYNNWTKSKTSYPYTIIEAAVLFESGLNKLLDFTILVTCPETLRIERVINRDQQTVEEIMQRSKRLLSQEELSLKSDFEIINDGKTPLVPQIIQLDKQLRK